MLRQIRTSVYDFGAGIKENVELIAWRQSKRNKDVERRYLGGLRPLKYFDEIVWPKQQETMEILGLSRARGLEVFNAFVEIDYQNVGEVSFEELHNWLGVKKTKFSERVFGILDQDDSGFLDFAEFLIGVWNWCTHDASLITKLAFVIFDADKDGELDAADCDALLRMVYDVQRADPELIEKMDKNGDGRVSLTELEQLIEVHNYILQPAFDLQRALRQRICGVRFWEAEMNRRRIYFSGYDGRAQSSWESIKAILAIKHHERIEEERRRQELQQAEEQVAEQAQKQRELQIRQELAARRRRSTELRNRQRESKEAKAERAAKEALERAHAQTEDEYIAADISIRIAQRETYWNAFDDWLAAAAAAAGVERQRRLDLTKGSDALARLEDEMAEPEGANKFKHQVALNYAYDLHDRLKDKKKTSKSKIRWSLRNMLADAMLSDPFGDGVFEPTALAALIQRFASTTALATAREQARAALLHDIRVREETKLRAELDAQDAANEQRFQDIRSQREGDFFNRHSKWERLWDSNYGAPYWLNWETGESLWIKPHVCHKCDAAIPPDDAKCFQCNTDRSPYNREIYWEHTGTRPKSHEASTNQLMPQCSSIAGSGDDPSVPGPLRSTLSTTSSAWSPTTSARTSKKSLSSWRASTRRQLNSSYSSRKSIGKQLSYGVSVIKNAPQPSFFRIGGTRRSQSGNHYGTNVIIPSN